MPPGRPPSTAPANHPALSLSIGSDDRIQSLAKLTPISMPNDALVDDLKRSYPHEKRWTRFRNSAEYVFVMSWTAQCRGYVKLASEYFDADLLEMELFALVQPPVVDEMALLSNKLRLALLSKVHGKRVHSLAQFESLFRVYYGPDTPLKGHAGQLSDQASDEAAPLFDDLFIDEKFHVLFLLMAEVSTYADFREYIDKNNIVPGQLRPEILFREPRGAVVDEYVLVFDNTTCYRRTTRAVELEVPKKRRLAPSDPATALGPGPFDVSASHEIVFRNVYELDRFIGELKQKKTKKNRALLDVVASDDFVDHIFACELKKRRIIHSRKKESQMARLLATRKRSSRLEAKEKQRSQEEHERKAHELADLQYAVLRRSSHRTRAQAQMDYSAGLTREERLKRRLEADVGEGEADVVLSEVKSVKSEDPEEIEVSAKSEEPENTITPNAMDVEASGESEQAQHDHQNDNQHVNQNAPIPKTSTSSNEGSFSGNGPAFSHDESTSPKLEEINKGPSVAPETTEGVTGN
ncbi:hypothetical protein FDK38_000459 [Candidozyma auris]|nr:hypothetical protein FDK38_000459 [[Candida] auris]